MCTMALYCILWCTSTGHVHDVIVLYRRTIHIRLYFVDQSQEPVAEEPYLRVEERSGPHDMVRAVQVDIRLTLGVERCLVSTS